MFYKLSFFYSSLFEKSQRSKLDVKFHQISSHDLSSTNKDGRILETNQRVVVKTLCQTAYFRNLKTDVKNQYLNIRALKLFFFLLENVLGRCGWRAGVLKGLYWGGSWGNGTS